jgi:hypothetical protein
MGLHDNYGFALAAQPGESQRRPATNSNSRFIVQNGLPALGAPGASIPDGRTIRRNRQDPSGISGAGIFIPVTNPIESTFATVRHRTIRSKGCLSNKTALAMVFKLIEGAQKSWRRLDGHNQLPKLVLGVTFNDGIEVIAKPTDRQPITAAA